MLKSFLMWWEGCRFLEPELPERVFVPEPVGAVDILLFLFLGSMLLACSSSALVGI